MAWWLTFLLAASVAFSHVQAEDLMSQVKGKDLERSAKKKKKKASDVQKVSPVDNSVIDPEVQNAPSQVIDKKLMRSPKEPKMILQKISSAADFASVSDTHDQKAASVTVDTKGEYKELDMENDSGTEDPDGDDDDDDDNDNDEDEDDEDDVSDAVMEDKEHEVNSLLDYGEHEEVAGEGEDEDGNEAYSSDEEEDEDEDGPEEDDDSLEEGKEDEDIADAANNQRLMRREKRRTFKNKPGAQAEAIQLIEDETVSKVSEWHCIQAVLIEPRRLKAIGRVAESVIANKDINVLTIAHGALNQDYLLNLTKQSPSLAAAYNQSRLQFLRLDVRDLGGDDQKETEVKPDDRGLLIQAEAPRVEGKDASKDDKEDALLERRENEGVMSEQQYHYVYSMLMKSINFWEKMSCDQVLVMQSDTLLCPDSKVKLSEFGDYDYVGGYVPGWSPSYNMSGKNMMNGGFSLRKKASVMDCLKTQGQQEGLGEDEYYSFFCPSFKYPSADAANRFCVDNGHMNVDEIPFGVHKPWNPASPYKDHTLDICKGSRDLQAEVEQALA